MIWNSLPLSVRHSSKLSSFKSKLKIHLFSSNPSPEMHAFVARACVCVKWTYPYKLCTRRKTKDWRSVTRVGVTKSAAREPLDTLCDKTREPLDTLCDKTREPLDTLCDKTREPLDTLCDKTRDPLDTLCDKTKELLDPLCDKMYRNSNFPLSFPSIFFCV